MIQNKHNKLKLRSTKDLIEAHIRLTELEEEVVILKNSSSTLPYKVYSALVSQSSTNAPIAIVLENTLGVDITFLRKTPAPGDTGGNYEIATVEDTFTIGKTAVFTSPTSAKTIITLYVETPNYISMFTYDTVAGIHKDSILNSTFLEIRVYE